MIKTEGIVSLGFDILGSKRVAPYNIRGTGVSDRGGMGLLTNRGNQGTLALLSKRLNSCLGSFHQTPAYNPK